jgi:NADPH2:quinone reductase
VATLDFPQTQKPGFTPGYDCVGVIESIGEVDDTPHSRGFEAGDIVAVICVIGAYASHLSIPLNDCLKLKKSDDLVKMAATPVNYMTAYGMLSLSAFPVTESTHSVLIGSVAGGVGTALAQVAKMLFPGLKIFGTCSPAKFEFVRALGVIPIDRTLSASDLAATVLELNNGEGVDIAYEMVGSEVRIADFVCSGSS